MESVSVVMPVHNEAPVIRAVLEDLHREIVGRIPGSQIVVVDDCSTDSTAEILQRAAVDLPHVTVEHSTANRGHGPSVIRALEIARCPWIFHVDSDGQFFGEDFWRLWDEREGSDLVLGARVERQDPRHRLVLSRVIAAVASRLAGRRLTDPNVPFKLFRREVWTDLSPHLDPSSLAPSIMLAVGAARRGWRITEVPVRHLPRAHGVSTLRAFRLFRFSLTGLLQVIRFCRACKKAADAQETNAHSSQEAPEFRRMYTQ